MKIMSDLQQFIHHMPERNRQRNQMHQYINTNRNDEIKNKGYVDSTKLLENMRILVLNPNGLDPWNDYKMNLFINAIEKLEIDVVMISELNLKTTTANQDKMTQRMRKLGREMQVFMADSGQ